MDAKAQNHTVAKLIRIEQNQDSGQLFLVFEAIDEQFKQKVKKDFTADIDLIMNEKELKEIA
jgi:hypothetical protein